MGSSRFSNCVRDSASALIVNSLVGIAVMALALALPALLYALLDAQRSAVGATGPEPGLSVFLKRSVTLQTARALAGTLRGDGRFKTVTLISADEAYADLAQSTGLGAQPAGLNPLPHVLFVAPRAAFWEHQADAEFSAEMSAHEAVDMVIADRQWVDRLKAISSLAQRLVSSLAVLLTAAAVLVVGNGIRNLVFQQAREVEVLKLVGATDAFVRRPFLYSGVIHGLLAGVLAWAVLLAVFMALSGPVAELSRAYGSSFRLGGPPAGFSVALVITSTLAGWSGALLGTAYSLRRLAPGTD